MQTGTKDRAGHYSATLTGSSLALPGATFTFLPSNQPNVVRGSNASALSISLPAGNYTALNFLGTGMYGNQANQVFTVNYTDNSSTQFTQSLSDWWTPNNNPGETTAMQLAYLDQSWGGQLAHPVQLYEYSFPLNKSKTVQSFTLPQNSNVIVAAVALSSQTADIGTVTLSVNGSAISTASYDLISTPASIAASLAANASTSAPVYVAAVNDALYLTSTTDSSSTDSINYLLWNTTYDSTDFGQPSFPYAPIYGTLSGDLSGGSSGGSSNSGVTLYSYSVPSGGYSPNGNLLTYTDSVMGQWSYTYDSLNRVISGSPASGNTANAGLNLCWSYDAFGNRTAQAAQSTACPSVSSPPFPTAAYNTNNQVTFVQNTAPMGYSYDASGDVTSDNTNTYLYDAEGRICAVRSEPVAGTYTMTGYLYDADGTRVAKGTITNWSCDPATSGLSTTNDYILGQGGEQMTEMTMNGDGSTLVWEHTNVFAGGKIIATYSQDNTGSQTQNSALHFYLDDPLGSRRVQTDYAGVVEKSCQSLPFGDGETCLATPTEHLFTGKERDAESGNDYFGARYYNSSVGRFLSPDPFLNSGHPEDPQSWNRYSYVRNNPLGRTDPTGLYDFSKCAKGDSNCQAEKDRFNTGIKKANALLKGMDPKSKEAKELSKALKALGSAGDKNGVTVAFGKTVTGGDMETAGSHITVDFNAVDQSQLAAGKNIDGVVDDAADEVHEGIHVARYERGQPGSGEEEAYRATSYVGEAGHSNLSTGVWDESWAKGPDKELLRNNAIKDAVKRSEDATKEYEDKQKQ